MKLWTDGRRTTEPAYTISSPGAFGSGELKMRPGLPAGHYLGDRDEKYVIGHQNMRSQGLTGLSGPIATSAIVHFRRLQNVLMLTFPDFSYS